ncbi:uncharacterized protein LOC135139150 [Zophobas morio]|uniref:uncharacterized protein LOC135139150 n=1 Tax=Zophobas morio TaxID=2755281 RepID=UPI00308382E9
MFASTTLLLLLTSCASFFITLATNDPTEMVQITQACLNESGATMEMVRNYKPSKKEPEKELLCFIKCNFEKMGYVMDNGTVCVESMKEDGFIEAPDDDKETIYECLEGVAGVETCEDAWDLEKCVVGISDE